MYSLQNNLAIANATQGNKALGKFDAGEAWRLIRRDAKIPMSWGVNDLADKNLGSANVLTFKVQGRLFKGIVVVAYNYGKDLYEVYLLKSNKLFKHMTEIYAEDLVEILDRAIETK